MDRRVAIDGYCPSTPPCLFSRRLGPRASVFTDIISVHESRASSVLVRKMQKSASSASSSQAGGNTSRAGTSAPPPSSGSLTRPSTSHYSASPSSSSMHASSSSFFPAPDLCKRLLEDARDTAWRRRLRLKLLQKKRGVDKGGTEGGGSTEETSGGTEGREKNIIRLQKLANRIKKISEAEKDALLSELGKHNVSLFLSEFADSICEVDFKISDVKAVVEVCMALHETYPEFLPLLKQSLQKQIKMTVESASSLFPSSSSSSSSAILPQDLSLRLSAWSSRVRVLSRFVCELYLTTLLPEPSLFTALLYFLTAPYSLSSASTPPSTLLTSRSSSTITFAQSSPTSSSAPLSGPGCSPSKSPIAPSNPLATASWTSSLPLCLVRIGIVSSFCRKAGRQVLLSSRPSPFSLLRKALLVQNNETVKEVQECGEELSRTSTDCDKGSEGVKQNGATEGGRVWPSDLVREAMEKVGVTEGEISEAVAEEAETRRGDAERKAASLLRHFYLSSVSLAARHVHQQLVEQEQQNIQQVVNKGQADQDSNARFLQLSEKLKTLLQQANVLAQVLEEQLLDMQEIQAETARVLELDTDVMTATRVGGGTGTGLGEESKGTADGEEPDEASMWRDTKEKEFYTDLLDLKEVVPAVLLGLKEGKEGGGNAGDSKSFEDSNKESPGAPDGDETAGDSKDNPASSSTPSGSSSSSVSSSASSCQGMDLLLLRLSQATESHVIDQIAVEIFYERLNTKPNRALLMKSIAGVPRTHLHLLPFYARLLAILRPYMKDVCNYVLDALQAELKKILEEKHPTDIENKIKCIRFIGECTKFGLLPAGLVMSAFNSFLEDMTPHHVELVYHIADTCGYYLLHMPLTRQRFSSLLEKMLRIKGAKNLTARLDILIEEAYHQLRPSNRSNAKSLKDQPPQKLFMHRLIFSELPIKDEGDVSRVLRRFPWSTDAKVETWFRECILDADMHTDFDHMHRVAALLCVLAKYLPQVVIGCVDSLLESIQAAMEREDPRESPVRVRQIKLLGELYNYRVVDSSVIFDTLYHLCGLGAATSYQAGNIRTAHRILAEQARLHGLHLPATPSPQNFSKVNGSSSEDIQEKSLPVSPSSQTTEGGCTRPTASSPEYTEEESSVNMREKGEKISTASTVDSQVEAEGSVSQEEEEGDIGREGRTGSGLLFFGGLYDQEILPLVHPSAPIDWPHSCFRIKLVCTLLQTCGHYFCRGSLKYKLDRFLLFFQRFVRAKPFVPFLVEADYLDTLENLRPNLQVAPTLQDAEGQLREVLKEEAKCLASMGDMDELSRQQEEAEEALFFPEEDEEEESDDEQEDGEDEDEEDEDAEAEEGDNKGGEEEDLADYVRDPYEKEAELQFENDFAQMVLASINEAKTGRRVGGEVTKIPQSILKEALTSPFTTTPGTSRFPAGGEQVSSRGGIGEVGQSGLSPEKGIDGEGGGDVSVTADELTDSPTEEGEARPPPTIMCLVLRRPDKRNRFLVRPLAVPADNKLSAEQQRRKDEQEKQEQEDREDLKRFVMDHVSRSVEEDEREGVVAGSYSGGGGSRYSYASSSSSSTGAGSHYRNSLISPSAGSSSNTYYYGGAESFSGSTKGSYQVPCPGALTSPSPSQHIPTNSTADSSQRRKGGRGSGVSGARAVRAGRKR
ncbi:mif4g domain-containing protein [Cystoisospora suis]|uniref:Mif4g domain-containing protein n=1 Tax=Cystoisospora suis TaxID=483139 RepID=A0A2C6L936_9APIC|nr:mif4g domain-containing protein [Cystoisospora suis]